jgi:hypothetical protein
LWMIPAVLHRGWCMSMSPCCMFMLHIHAACPCYMSMSPCYMSMLLVHDSCCII